MVFNFNDICTKVLPKIEYRRIKPESPWVIYGGEDGGVIVWTCKYDRVLKSSPGWCRVKQHLDSQSYWRVSLRFSEGVKRIRVAPLIAEAFDLKSERGTSALHSHADKDDNRSKNIRWGDAKQNKGDEYTADEQIHKKQLRSERKHLVITLSFNGVECHGKASGSDDDAQAVVNTMENVATCKDENAVVSLLLHRYLWALRGVRELEHALPEKFERFFVPDRGDGGVELPRNWKIAPDANVFKHEGHKFADKLYYPVKWLSHRDSLSQSGKWVFAECPSSRLTW